MTTKKHILFIVRLVLLLALAVGTLEVIPARAEGAPADTTGDTGAIPQVQIITPSYPIGMDAGETELVPYKLQETANVSGKFTSKSLQFFTQYGVALSGVMGPYPTTIQVNALSTTTWNESVYLPANVVSAARSMKKYAIVLKTTFIGTSKTGMRFSAESSLLLLLPPASFSKSSPANGAVVSLDNLSLRWNSSVGAIDYEYCFDTIDNNSCDTEWIGTYWVSTYHTFAALKSLPSKTFYWQVRATNLSGKTDANSGKWWSFKVILPAPSLASPNKGDHILTLRPTFDWDDVTEAGVTGYTIQISSSSTFATVSHTGNPVNSTYTPTVDLPKGKLYWRVRTNGTNGPSAWSEVRSYQGPYPPAAPVPSLPANNGLLTDTTPLFKWSVLSIPASAAPFDHYQLQVAKDTGFTSLILDETTSGLSTNTFTPATVLATNTRYYWRVRGVNTLPENGAWSAIWSFRTALLPVSLNPLPNNNHPTELRPTFRWSDPNLTAPLATGYSIQIAATNNFSTLLTSGTTVAGVTSYKPAINLPGGKLLYWRVRANGVNGPSLWATGSFTSPTPPSTSSLLLPANNSLNTNYTPTLKWSVVTSAVPFHHYQVQVDDDPLFLSPAVDDVTHTLASQNRLITPALPHNVKFYWRVLAFNTNGQYSTSAVWSFRTSLLPVTLNTLQNNNHPYTVRPTFSWVDPNITAPLATGYYIQIAAVSNFSTLITTGTTTTNSYKPTINLPGGKLLYWRARANGVNGPSLWTSGSFTTPTPPSVPALLLPANTSLNTNYTPTLKWSVVTSVIGFHHYQVQVDDDPLFLSPEVDDSTHTLASQNQLTTPSLPHNVKFYWRVLAFNNIGQYSTSAVWSFRTRVDAPTLLTPDSETSVGTLKPVFDWDAPIGPITSYTIQVATSPTFGTLLVNSTTVDSTYTRLTNFPAGKTLYWRVRANGVNGPSAWSSTFSFITP